jgi:hypothetical protein
MREWVTYGEGEGDLEGLVVFVRVAHVAVDLEVVSKLVMGGGVDDDGGLTLGNTPWPPLGIVSSSVVKEMVVELTKGT